jgi:pimeloyl-ACP methyl ester carboxylesterase
MAKAVPGSRLVVIPDVAHLSNIENPDAFNASVKEFIGRLK